MPRKIAAGNWKMNGTANDISELAALAEAHPNPKVGVVICPPATLMAQFSAQSGAVEIGGQDCHTATNGAHTGDISAHMLKAAGASHVIIGHSERRTDHGETDGLIAQKAEAAYEAGLVAVICIGETLEEREADEAVAKVSGQVKAGLAGVKAEQVAEMVIAYEPIWAIGTGKTASPEDAQQMCKTVRDTVRELPFTAPRRATRHQSERLGKELNVLQAPASVFGGQPALTGACSGHTGAHL